MYLFKVFFLFLDIDVTDVTMYSISGAISYKDWVFFHLDSSVIAHRTHQPQF